MNVKSINDIPREVVEESLMPYLSSIDVRKLGLTNKRFKESADYVLKKRRKFKNIKFCNTSIFFMIFKVLIKRRFPKNLIVLFLLFQSFGFLWEPEGPAMVVQVQLTYFK